MKGWNQGEYENKRAKGRRMYGEEKSCFWVEENCVFTEKTPKIITFVCVQQQACGPNYK
jgi:hypothetical protein